MRQKFGSTHKKMESPRTIINEGKYKVIFKFALKNWLHKTKIEAMII